MDRWLLGLLAGLVGGAGGALAVHLLFQRAEAPPATAGDPARATRPEHPDGVRSASAGPTLAARAEDTLAARLERIERLLEAGKGRADAATDPVALALVRKAVGEEMEARMGALAADVAEGKNAKPPEPKKKRVTLSDAARELDLTSTEEAELRRIYADTQEKYLKILAGPEGDVDVVRREVEEAKKDPKKGPLLMAKYMPKVLPRIGEFIQVSMEQDAAVQTALGPDKAARLESGFNVIEADPLSTGGEMRIEANTR